MTDLFDDLAYRGLIHQETDREGLRRHAAGGPRLVYAGFDPTATSLTIGNLVPLLLLRRFQDAGHRPVVVMGGGTGRMRRSRRSWRLSARSSRRCSISPERRPRRS